ncbi:hypothetical protein FD680_00040 [Salmonella enterica]|nr:hypothetical protein [Salmonella enterica]EAV7825206.1 hypothetical protein [Salmonella enterica]EBF4478507.1 hypothetical protein [Salmonella enterica]EHL8756255.1 hypothetical protein [Salmonella enterica]
MQTFEEFIETVTFEELKTEYEFLVGQLLSKEKEYDELAKKHEELEKEHVEMMKEYKATLEQLIVRNTELIELKTKNVKPAVKPTKKPTLRVVA